jgi:cytochrome c
MRKLQLFAFIIFILVSLASCTQREERILVFSKMVEFKHESTDTGIAVLQQLGKDNEIQVDTTKDASFFTEDILKQYSAVVFINTTGDVLNYEQQSDFERYIQAGGGFVGIHSATDTEYDWPWYNRLVGAYFMNHPRIQEATLNILDKKHPSTNFMEDTWTVTDEWYNFRNINPDLNVLIEIDEKSYEGGKNGEHHPISWNHEFDGGRAFYTTMGHTREIFQNSTYQHHLLGGIKYAIGKNKLNYQASTSPRVPEETRFVKEVLDFNLDEPMELEELPNRGILFVERRGLLKLFSFVENTTKTLAQLNVRYGDEDGLLGLAVDPQYHQNHWIYLFYTTPEEQMVKGQPMGKQRVSRFELVGDSFDLASEKVLLEIPTIRKCCHSGGGLEFGSDGNLYIGVGDNTNPFESSGYAPIDEGQGRRLWDAQRSASNTNDLRGKILRVRPQADGTYSIPEGNLFPEGQENTRPEIYAMGCRNPFRFSIDSQTGHLYWGDIGPDAGTNDSVRGPKGMGEFNQARQAGYWGWPYTRGNNQVYHDYNFVTKTSGEKFDPKNIFNNSPNNTGLKKLPEVQSSLIWYSYDLAEEFRWLGKGGVNPMAGPVFHSSDFSKNKNGFPDYFDNKLFVYEWMRDWVYVVTLDENKNYVKAESFMPSTEFSHPMDMIFGEDGNMYILEYGQNWNVSNLDARLNRISYITGNRPPLAQIAVDKEVGAAPLTVQFSSTGSKDYDQDQLSYEWSFNSSKVHSTEAYPTFVFEKPGAYDVELKVTDEAGASATTNKKILVGNSPPQLTIELDTEDRIYTKGKKVKYQVVVADAEDGSTEQQSIDPSAVKVTLSYLAEGEDMIIATLGHQQNAIPEGQLLINNSDCKACHGINEKVNGPSYVDIAKKYSKEDQNNLVSSIIKGSVGIWGKTMMSAHPQLSVEEVTTMVKYILLLDPDQKANETTLPLAGTLEFKEHLAENSFGKYILMASYSDQGHPEVEKSSLSAREQIIFKAPKLQAEDANQRSEGLSIWDKGDNKLVGSITNNTFLKFKNIAFKNLNRILLTADYNSGYEYRGNVEIREGDLTGKKIGQAKLGYFDADKNSYKHYKITVSPTIDQGDLFLVFKNPKDEKQFVLNADWIMLDYNN